MSDDVREKFEKWINDYETDNGVEFGLNDAEAAFLSGYQAAQAEAAALFSEIGALIPMHTEDGKLASFKNDPPDAIADAVKRRINTFDEALRSSLETNHALVNRLNGAAALVYELVEALNLVIYTVGGCHDCWELGGTEEQKQKVKQTLTKAQAWRESCK